MIATNIEQSKHLLELGLDPATADMCWVEHPISGFYLMGITDNLKICKDDTPAWSLSALLEVMPKECEPDLQKSPLSGVYFVHWFADGKPNITDDYKTAIEAAYAAVVWLLEQGYIKKGGQDDDRREGI